MNEGTQAPSVIDNGEGRGSGFEALISRLLRGGVVVSLLTCLLGIGVMLARPADRLRAGAVLTHLTTATDGNGDDGQVGDGLFSSGGRVVAIVGVLLLILTPVLRVCASVAAFALERDWRFTAITAAVLVVLIVSFLLGEAG